MLDIKFALKNKLSNTIYKEQLPVKINLEYVLLNDKDDIDTLKIIFLEKKSVIVNSTKIFMMKYLMTHVSPDIIANLVSKLGFSKLNDRIDVFYDLLWYLYNYDDGFGNHLSNNEISYLSGLNGDQIVKLLPSGYNYPHDRAMLLYIAVSGKLLFQYDIRPDRHKQLIQYSPTVIWRLAVIRYGMIDIVRHNVIKCNLATCSPYQFLALYPKDDIEDIFIIANSDNIDHLIDRYGVIIDKATCKEWKLADFLEQISNYDQVFIRNPDSPSIDKIIINTEDDICSKLEQYTTRELMSVIEPGISYHDRDYLIKYLCDIYRKY